MREMEEGRRGEGRMERVTKGKEKEAVTREQGAGSRKEERGKKDERNGRREKGEWRG
jgi:hypothetical protein